MNCPRCNSNKKVKDGIINKRQRYLCKKCGYRYTVEERGTSGYIKKLALQLFIAGVSYRNIGSIFKVSQVSIMRWVKVFKPIISKGSKNKIDLISFSELNQYLQKRKEKLDKGLFLIGMDKETSILCVVKKEKNNL